MTKDEKQSKDLKLDKTILTQIRQVFIWAAGFSFFSNILMLTMPIFMMNLFMRVLPSGSMQTLWALIVVAGGALALQALLEGLRTSMLTRMANWVESRLASDLFVSAVHETIETGRSQGAEPLRDLNRIRTFLTSPAFTSLLDAPWVPLFLLVLFLMHPYIGLVALIGSLILMGLAVANEMLTRRAMKQAGDETLKVFRKAQDNLRNAEVIAAMGMLPILSRRWDEESRASREVQVKATDMTQVISALTKYVRMMLQLAVMSTGVVLIFEQQLEPGAMIAAAIIVGRALMPIEMAISSSQQFFQARDAYERIKELLARTPEPHAAMKLPRPSGRVAAEKVVYAPIGGRKPIIKGVSANIEPGEVIGIAGPTAAGKSTLARLLIGVLRPTSGHVRLDGADVYSWASEDVGRHLGYLPQDVELFDGSVKENIARMDKPDDEKVLKAANMAGVHEMILALPNGYETNIGTAGAMLSGGQRQRIALARAFYGDPAVVVLDEPNSNLDSEGEQALMKCIREAKSQGATVIMVAHRPSVMSVVDKLLVLQDGQVVMFGPAGEIAKRLQQPRGGGAESGPLRVASSSGTAQASPQRIGSMPRPVD